MGKPRRQYTEAFKKEFIRRYQESGQTMIDFAKIEGVSYHSGLDWFKKYSTLDSVKRHRHGPYSPEERRQAIEAYQKSGLTQEDFCKTWGTTPGTLINWLKKYREYGPKGLEGYAEPKGDDKRKGRKISQQVIEEIVRIKNSDPQSGLKYIKQFMSRFKGVNVSTGSIKKTLVEAEIPLVKKEKKRRRSADKVRTFERALPMQLWQSDITSYVLTRHSQRVYLTVFMDDYSRYVVAWNLAMRQTTEFVTTTLLDGTCKFGKPEEVLTDQGRQYFAWRGRSDFQKLLDKEGIKHVVSRSHHPQTLGKCERFWETVGQEFWDRLKPQDLADAKRRFSHFINHYNHFRPHQGIGGLTPADRFFGLENEIRKSIEQVMSKNQLRLAIGEAPRTPVFLVGQIGDQPISLHGEGGKLVLSTPDGETKELSYGEFGHFKKGVDNGRYKLNEANSEETRKEEGICDSIKGADSSEESLVFSESGREAVGTQDSDDFASILDGPQDEERSSRGIENTSVEDLAIVGTSSGGNGGGPVEATENQERDNGEYEQRRRSEIFKEENSGARENNLLTESADRCLEGDAGLHGCEYTFERSGAGSDGEEVD